MKENKEIEAVVLDSDNNSSNAKKEKIYSKKDIITTAIIAFLIGAIITAGGFAISKTLKGERGDRDFRPDGIQRNIDKREFDNSQNSNGNQGKMNRRGNRPNTNNQSTPNMQDNQNPPSIPNNNQVPNNSQQPNNANAELNDNNQNSESNKSYPYFSCSEE